jgi:aspartyl-tRNA(Asn)/glutamyl-tRNA(Gln) amidotransferase subunit A
MGAMSDDPLNIFITRCETTGTRRCGVKDLFHTAGIRTTYGSRIYAEHVPTDDAVAWSRLKADGWTLAGKTNLHEFAYGTSSQNPWYGTVRNPHDPSRVAGGSSGGSAAGIVTGAFELGLGTDTAGSIRIPASWCGVVGFKPTHGAIPGAGCFSLVPWLDHPGPIAADVATCAAAYAVMAERAVPPPLDPASLDIAVVDGLDGIPVDASVAAAVAGAIARVREAGAAIRPSRWERVPAACARLRMRASARLHMATFPSRADEYGADTARKLAIGLEEFSVAEQVVAMPTLPIGPPPVDVDEVSLRGTVFAHTHLFNHLGWPSITVPCGSDADGLPVGLMLSGPGDDVVLGAALALEPAVRGGQAPLFHDAAQ